jgi:sugar transferase (PEP-CTERM system associated)
MLKVFAHHFKALTFIEFMADTMVCFFAIFLASNQLITTQTEQNSAFTTAPTLATSLGFAFIMSMMFAFFGLYRRGVIFISLSALLRRAFLAVSIGLCIAFFALTIEDQNTRSIPLLIHAVSYMVVGVVIVRSLAFIARQYSLGAKRVLIIGTGAEAQEVASDIKNRGHNQTVIVGFYPAGVDTILNHPRVFSKNKSLSQVAQKYRVDEIVVAVKEQRGGALPMDQLLTCRIQGIRIVDLAGFYERAHGEVPVDSLKSSWLVYGNGFIQGSIRTVIKRVFDIISSLLLLIFTCPIMLCAAVAVRLESPGPIIYRQTRVGLHGTLFTCLKFRSMRTDAEIDGIARWATKNDSRITRVGSLMRKTRIDELPQLFSVLHGEMSLVGPRPERPAFVAQLREQIPYYDIRHSVKPGLTGWAQVRYGYGASVNDSRKKHQFDLYYVKNNSLLLDVLVLIETVSVVLFREGSQ